MAGGKLKKQLHQPWFGGGMGAILCALLGVWFLFVSFGKGLEDWSYDLPFLLREPKAITNVVMVYLDEESCQLLNQSPAAFDRSLHAQVLQRLQAAGAKLVTFDVLFIDNDRPLTKADETLAAAMRTSKNVVIGAKLHEDYHGGSYNGVTLPPIDLFRTNVAGWGIVKLARESDFSARKHHPGPSEEIPSLAWKTAELAGAEVTKRPELRGTPKWFNYYAPEPFRSVSYWQIVSNMFPDDLSFRDKFVFIGSGEVSGFTGEEKEEYRYPWTWRTQHFPFGVEIHALTFANLLRGDWMNRWPEAMEIFVLALTGMLLGYGLSIFRPVIATGVALLAALLVAAFALLLATRFNSWFAWLIIVGVQIPLALGWSYLFHSLRAYMETRLLQNSLELYLSPKQVKQILKQPELLKPGATQKNVSILFSDIASFSKISERMNPDDLVKLLNEYYEAAIGCVHETGGTVMNLIGDAIFAIWNAPQEQADHQERAARAALLLNEKLFHFDTASLNLPLRTRIGLHTGVVCVGNIGSSTHFDFTAIGESVNLASRLEGLNKYLGTNILATRDIQKSVEGKLFGRLVGHFQFKGFNQVVEVHEMIGPLEMKEATKPWRDSFAEGLRCFQRKSFPEAEQQFRRTMELRPDDGPSKFYLERIALLRMQPPPSDWVGEIDLREK
jgi:adenylate cyclase